MRYLPILLMVCLLVSCDKGTNEPEIPKKQTFDEYLAKANIVAGQIYGYYIDSDSNNMSYFQILKDTSLRSWRYGNDTMHTKAKVFEISTPKTIGFVKGENFLITDSTIEHNIIHYHLYKGYIALSINQQSGKQGMSSEVGMGSYFIKKVP